MKKGFKIFSYLFLVVFLLLTVAIIFLSSSYDKATEKIKKESVNLTTTQAEFYQFPLSQPSADKPILVPMPKAMQWTNHSFKWPINWILNPEQHSAQRLEWLERLTSLTAITGKGKENIVFFKNENLSNQGYKLAVNGTKIQIDYGTENGLYYGLTTLSQLKKLYPENLNGLVIEDAPDLELRGVMLDISRDKVPTLNTLFEIVDQLALLKINHLQLYVEGFSYGYPSFKHLWEGKETPITPAEIQQLDQYCQARFIDLAANQNSLGHMAPWLETAEYQDLAECPDGFGLVPLMKMKTTLSPQDPRSIELVKKMMDDMIPNFSSSIFNANLDEPFELGHCKSEDLAKEIGVGQVYLDYTKKVYEHAKSYDKEFWMWGDIVGKHPEIIEQLPKDITVLEWGYEHEHPFDKNTARIKAAGLEFIVCPGTSSWMSLTGRTENMLGNISNAVRSGITNGAKGMLLTDWGDMGHWQYLPVSFAGFVYAAGVSWHGESDQSLPLEAYLNRFIFEDEKNKMGALALEMGRISKFEGMEVPNLNQTFLAYQFGLIDPVLEHAIMGGIQDMAGTIAGPEMSGILKSRFENKKAFDYEGLSKHLNQIETTLNTETEMNLQQVNVLKDEFRNGIQMVRLGAEVKKYNEQKDDWTVDEAMDALRQMKTTIEIIQAEHQRLWLIRNKSGGLTRSLKNFKKLESAIDEHITIMGGSNFDKKIDKLKDKIIAGGVNWYLN